MGLSENSVPLNPMVLLIIIPTKWLFHWEYTQHFQTNPNDDFGLYSWVYHIMAFSGPIGRSYGLLGQAFGSAANGFLSRGADLDVAVVAILRFVLV